MIDKLERKYGKLAISNLTLKLLAVYGIGYLIYYMASATGNSTIYNYILLDPYQIIHSFQIWRLVSWVLAPPQMSILSFLITAVFFYYPIGRSMESAWGDFRYTLYIFSGFIFTIIGAFLLYLYYAIVSGGDAGTLMSVSMFSSISFTPYYVTMSIFFAYAATFPDATVLFMFIIPMKMKYLGYVYAAFNIYYLYSGNAASRVVIICSLLNFVIYYLLTRKDKFGRYRPKEVKRRKTYQQAVKMTPPGVARHRCAVCGRTELDDPNLEFRYCSKCKGNLEYCQDHLFTHKHVQ